ncbi:MAG: hypothetical protein FJZ97_11725, partial [Chloroflexi bacterium]|nr:hypothetical protein [Chloroflexota bacterium]
MGLFPRQVEAVLAGMPWGPNSNAYIVDPQVGSDSNDGLRWQRPLKTLAAAFAKCTTNQNDVVLLVGGPTALNPTEAVVWNKDYTHLVGLSAPIAMGQRCRIVNHADNDLAVLFTLSGNGCIVKNVQFFDGKDKDEDASALVVSGSRNYFENVFVAGIGHATTANRAGSKSLTVSGSENRFVNCTVGLDTIRRTAATNE